MDLALVIGVVVGCVVAVAVIVVIIVLCMRRKRQAAHNNPSKLTKVKHTSRSNGTGNGKANGHNGSLRSVSQSSNPGDNHQSFSNQQTVINVPAVYEVINTAQPTSPTYEKVGRSNLSVRPPEVSPIPPSLSSPSRPTSQSVHYEVSQPVIYGNTGFKPISDDSNQQQLSPSSEPPSFQAPRATAYSPPPRPTRSGTDSQPVARPKRKENADVEGGDPYAVSSASRIEFDGGVINRAASLDESLEVDVNSPPLALKPVAQRPMSPPPRGKERRPKAPDPVESPLGSQLIADSNAFAPASEPFPVTQEHVYANRAFIDEIESELHSAPVSPTLHNAEPEPVYINYVSPVGSDPALQSAKQLGASPARGDRAPAQSARSNSAHTLHEASNRFSLPAGTAHPSALSKTRSNRSINSSSSTGSIRKKVRWATGVKAPDETADEARKRYESSMPQTISMAESCV